jgi:hypothetical protein
MGFVDAAHHSTPCGLTRRAGTACPTCAPWLGVWSASAAVRWGMGFVDAAHHSTPCGLTRRAGTACPTCPAQGRASWSPTAVIRRLMGFVFTTGFSMFCAPTRRAGTACPTLPERDRQPGRLSYGVTSIHIEQGVRAEQGVAEGGEAEEGGVCGGLGGCAELDLQRGRVRFVELGLGLHELDALLHIGL